MEFNRGIKAFYVVPAFTQIKHLSFVELGACLVGTRGMLGSKLTLPHLSLGIVWLATLVWQKHFFGKLPGNQSECHVAKPKKILSLLSESVAGPIL